jgi:hypothetical protein
MLSKCIYVRYPFAPCIINEFLWSPCNTLNPAYSNHLFELARKYDLYPLDVLIGGGV